MALATEKREKGGGTHFGLLRLTRLDRGSGLSLSGLEGVGEALASDGGGGSFAVDKVARDVEVGERGGRALLQEDVSFGESRERAIRTLIP
jgi:hypothetical protein